MLFPLLGHEAREEKSPRSLSSTIYVDTRIERLMPVSLFVNGFITNVL